MKPQLIDSPDAIHARLLAKNTAHLARWGVECREWPLSDVATLTYDGRRIRRNFDLIDALAADGRFLVDRGPVGGFSGWRVGLK